MQSNLRAQAEIQAQRKKVSLFCKYLRRYAPLHM
jgi:hypothetical protein